MLARLISAALLCALLLLVVAIPLRSTAQTAQPSGQPDQIVLEPPPPGPQLDGTGPDYLSPPTEAPHPFTHLLARREAHVPEGASLTLSIRASADGENWTDWLDLSANDDLWMETDGPDVEWSQTIDTGQARFWQVRGFFGISPDGVLPELRRIEVNTVDTSAFSPPPEAPANTDVQTNAGVEATAAVPKPAVVSRIGWGCPDGEKSQAPPDYYPVNHITVHHTADSSTLQPGEPDWAARVRAEWSFHTYTRGWGDIGYNYLIDPNGVIYEGRAGGDDAVGFHDTANYGSMGVVIIGTYTSSPPSTVSQDSLVRLMAWKASQKKIDPLGQSFYYGCSKSSYCAPYNPGAVVVNIAGHRQVTPGHTTCPGDAFMALMPSLRNRVKQLISGGPSDNGDLEIDELELPFASSPANWYDAACGAGGHTYYTYTTDNPAESTNSATWRPNIPTSGTYRVYASIPQGCGLGSPPYASTKATYRIHSADGNFQRTVDQNTAEAWVDLGLYTFNAGTDGAVELYDLTGEPFSNQRVLFFDTIKWVPETASTNVQLVDMQYERTSLAAGELLKVAFTVKNIGDTIAHGQAPQVPVNENGVPDSANDGYVYDQSECYLGDSQGSYPAYPKETNSFRVVLGPIDMSGIPCSGNVSGYPWRWGLNSDLAPGQQQTVIGYIRFRVPGTYTLQSGLVQEFVKYYAEHVNTTIITVTPERVAPDSAAYDSALQSLAYVYRLGSIPDNFLARTSNAISVPRGEYMGSFAWDGSFIDWGVGGPFGLNDQYLIEQTRSFVAPVNGTYTFRTTSDDGSWLWIDGQPVVVNAGLHPLTEVDGAITLTAGTHIIAFKYFERSGGASAGYAVQLPTAGVAQATEIDPRPSMSDGFTTVSGQFGGSIPRIGNTLVAAPDVELAADDLGGSGVASIRWSLDGATWQSTPGALLRLGKENFPPGSYRISYQPFDSAGNAGAMREVTFTVDPNMPLMRTYLPLVFRA